MHNLLNKLFEKRGITDVNSLDKEEREVFESYNKVLSQEPFGVDNIKAFCESQISIIEGKWASLELENAKKSELIPYHTVYKILLHVIESPNKAKEQMEKHLELLINQ